MNFPIKAMKKLNQIRSNLQKQQQGWPEISNPAKKYNKDYNLENTTAKFKCTREHILGHDWLILITWDKVRETARGQNWEASSEFLKFKHPSRKFFHVYIINK